MKMRNEIAVLLTVCGLLFGANTTMTGNNGLDGRLRNAAKQGSIQGVQQLLAAGANVNAPGSLKLTALHYAAGRGARYLEAPNQGHADVAQLLIDAGADVNAVDFLERTPLHHAVKSGWEHVARVLVARGANVGAKRRGGFTPLDDCLNQGLSEHLQAASCKRLEAIRKRREAIGQWVLRLEHELPTDVVRHEILPALPEMVCEEGMENCAVLRCAILQQVCRVACDGRDATPSSSVAEQDRLAQMMRLLKVHPNVDFEFADSGDLPLLRGSSDGRTLRLASPDGVTRIEFPAALLRDTTLQPTSRISEEIPPLSGSQRESFEQTMSLARENPNGEFPLTMPDASGPSPIISFDGHKFSLVARTA